MPVQSSIFLIQEHFHPLGPLFPLIFRSIIRSWRLYLTANMPQKIVFRILIPYLLLLNKNEVVQNSAFSIKMLNAISVRLTHSPIHFYLVTKRLVYGRRKQITMMEFEEESVNGKYSRIQNCQSLTHTCFSEHNLLFPVALVFVVQVEVNVNKSN